MPIINITNSEKGNNKGTAIALVEYLEKENQNKPKESHELWFNNREVHFLPQEVLQKIDNNKKGLKNNEAKFFLVNIAPSEKELKFLIDKYGEVGIKEKLKIYANQVMEIYAKNFNRKGIEGADELIYFGKIEKNRYYTYEDEDVKYGVAKRGDLKKGLNWHAQIVVSRKDVSQKISLSPLNNSSGKNVEFSSKFGQFNMKSLKINSEKVFDNLFNYERNPEESFLYLNTQKNGSPLEKASLLAFEKMRYEPSLIENYQSRNLGTETLNSLASLFLNISNGTTVGLNNHKKKKGKRI